MGATENIMITVDRDQAEWVRKQGKKFSQLTRWAIIEQKRMQEGDSTFLEEQRKRHAFQTLAQKQREFIEKKGLLDDWITEQTN